MIHIIYCSVTVQEFTEQDLIDLLAKSRANNRVLGVTGMLLFTEGSFFQILEGEQEVVEALFNRIHADARHANVTTIIREPIAKRDFGEWSMGFKMVTSSGEGERDGQNDFFTDSTCFSDLATGRSKKLLNAFRQGRWRTSTPAGFQRPPNSIRQFTSQE